MFIVFEGIDGSGKGTQIQKLKDYLESVNKKVWITAEPSNSKEGIQIRKILKKEEELLNPKEMAVLYARDRKKHIQEIREHELLGEIVISDRYYVSSFAYQGKDFPEEELHFLYGLNECFPKPDISILIDVPVEKALKRIQKRGQDLEVFEQRSSLEYAREIYLKWFRENENTFILEGDAPIEMISSFVKDIIKKRVA